ncbi:MAG: DUF4118 domain-containing protein [Acidobacteria bacterium]|nr:DUF4118 domain-containing protein [Acidobacteriota bacterium]
MTQTRLRTQFLSIAVSVALWGGLAWLDLSTGTRIRLGPVYALPVMLTSWNLGRTWGIAAALFSALLWHGIQVFVLHESGIPFYRHWDMANGLLSFLAISYAVIWAKQILLRVEEANVHLQEALEQVRTLEGMLPICAWCHKVRDDQGLWEQVESYVSKHSKAQWTHGICPSCAEKIKQEGPT